MSGPFQPAIDELEAEVKSLEIQLNGLISTINFLRQKAGMPPRGPGGSGLSSHTENNNIQATGALNIQPDAYFGKKMATAAREYLSARKASGISGPAAPKEIFEALKQGGFQFGSKDDANAKIVLNTMLRKYSSIFQKIGTGSYGLKSWYPDVRKPRSSGQSTSSNEPTNGREGLEDVLGEEIEEIEEEEAEEESTSKPTIKRFRPRE